MDCLYILLVKTSYSLNKRLEQVKRELIWDSATLFKNDFNRFKASEVQVRLENLDIENPKPLLLVHFPEASA